MEQFARLVQDDGWLRSLSPRPLTPDQIAPRLTGNGAALLGVAREAPPHVWTKRPGTGEPSPVELVAALELREREVNRPRLETIIREDDPPRAAARRAPARPLPEGWSAALAFAAERQRTLDLPAALPDRCLGCARPGITRAGRRRCSRRPTAWPGMIAGRSRGWSRWWAVWRNAPGLRPWAGGVT